MFFLALVHKFVSVYISLGWIFQLFFGIVYILCFFVVLTSYSTTMFLSTIVALDLGSAF